MRILQTSFYNPFLNDGGGVEQVIYDIAKNLHNVGHEVDVTCVSNKDSAIKTKFGNLYTFKVPEFKLFGKLGIFLRKAIYNNKLKNFVNENGSNYDIIHVHGDIGGFKELIRFNTILTLHGFSIQTHEDRSLLDRLFIKVTSGRTEINNIKYSKKTVAVSNNVKSFASKYTRKKIEVLYNGIDADIYAPVSNTEKVRIRHKLGFKDDAIYLLFVGGDAYRKGLDIAIDAVRLLSRNNAYLNIIGVGKQNRHTHDIIKFVGRVSELEKIRYYQASDIFILPSRGEGLALAPLEAMGCGLPVIVSKYTGINEIISNGREGIVVSQNKPESYYCAVKSLLQNETFRKAKIAAVQLAKKNDYKYMATKYFKLYKTVIGD